MLKLKDVSKFYYNKGVIASGFTKVSLDFELGEFVVITGESGSGKSTLLNVLSGTDSYEEGEMFINGEETSHYSESEFEDYRKKYIGNIFQNFNLVNSYTVYQNVELVLLINGYRRTEVKNKILEILKQVDLQKFKNTKVSKLSGGQKQRVAIARALAKETPIIIADEPTGNLDSRSAASVLEILHKISKDKLVIIVTHNYEQVEKYATRKIKMHDGRVVEDKKLQKTTEINNPSISKYKNINFFNKLRLGLRNTFNIIPKFLLIFMVYFFIVTALLAEYSAFKKAEYEESKTGYNGFFQDTTDSRIIIQKADGSAFSETDYLNIEALKNIDYLVKDDLLLDNFVSLNSQDLYLYGLVKNLSMFNEKLDVGRMPETEDEIIIVGRKDDYYISQSQEALLNSDLSLINNYTGEVNEKHKLKIVGIKYTKDLSFYSQYKFYVSETIANTIRESTDSYYSKIELIFASKTYESTYWNPYMQVVPNTKVPEGSAYISSDLNYNCANYNCRNKKIVVNNTNMYYQLSKELTITKLYTKNNFTSMTGLKNYNENNGKIFVNPNDYKNLFSDNYYQSSIFVENVKEIDETAKTLETMGIKVLKVKDALVNYNEDASQIIKIVKVVVTIILVIVMFFISYFIIKLILKSRNVYFTTIRILGSSKRIAKQLLDIELLTISNLAYAIAIVMTILVSKDIIQIAYLKDMLTYLKISDYIITYIVLIIMTQLISSKFAKSLFKKSAMKTFNEEV